MKRFIVIAVILAIVAGGFLMMPSIQNRIARERAIREQAEAIVPAPATYQSSSFSSERPSTAVNYDVPFTPQAPLQNWDALHEEACEEASALMVMRYFDGGAAFSSPDEAEILITQLVTDNEALGYPVDDTAEQLAALIRHKRPNLHTDILSEPSADDLRKRLRSGALIIVPAQGQWLKNPFYTAPGPRYHMLVIKGFTEDGRFITNDPGTKRGKDYVYESEILINAMHDWNSGDVEQGAKVAIAVWKD